MVHCPLDSTTNARFVERISTDHLSRVFEKALGFSIRNEIANAECIDFYTCQRCSLGFFIPALTGSDNFYESLQDLDWYYMNNKAEFCYARKSISPGDTVLDVGCGTAAFAKGLLAKSYVGLELNARAQREASQKGVRVLRQTVEEHARSNRENYDVVCAFQVLEHVANIRSFVEASQACLKPGGLLVYSVPNSEGFIARVPNNLMNLPPHHVTWWSESSLAFIAECFSLELVAVEREMLADIHTKMYATTFALESFRKLLGLQTRLLETSARQAVLRKVSGLIGRFLERGLDDVRLRPLGHSITAVYRKRSMPR